MAISTLEYTDTQKMEEHVIFFQKNVFEIRTIKNKA